MQTDIPRLEKTLREYSGRPLKLMEVCGTHTRQISRFGIPSLLSAGVSLISGPGCPVCVTPAGYIDRAAELSLEAGSTVLSFGDLMRVPGNANSLARARAEGGSVGLIYSPMEALRLAESEPERMFYIAAVGFETTAPAYALLAERLREKNIKNVRLLTSMKAIVPALEWICLNAPDIDGFLGPGHVGAITGWGIYEPVCSRHKIPLSVAGFEYGQLLSALCDLVVRAGRGDNAVANFYPGVVSEKGNLRAIELMEKYFTMADSLWRGLGSIEGSAYVLSEEFADYDAGGYDDASDMPNGCLCGGVITGRAKPCDCPLFGTVCTPASPVGPCMVSSEGACGIWLETGRKK